MTTSTAITIYDVLFERGMTAPFAQAEEPLFSLALDALFERAATDASLKPIAAAIQDAAWRFAFSAHAEGMEFGAAVTRAGLVK